MKKQKGKILVLKADLETFSGLFLPSQNCPETRVHIGKSGLSHIRSRFRKHPWKERKEFRMH